MKTTATCTHPPRSYTPAVSVPCVEAPGRASLELAVRYEPVVAAREEELRRRACIQRLAHLRDRAKAIQAICQTALSGGTRLC